MTRESATHLLRQELDVNDLKDWSIRLTPRTDVPGLCSPKDKCIILSTHHIDINPDPEILNTIKHEVAHALTIGHAHDEVWQAKARELGCTSVGPCSHLTLPPDVIDAIRSGATLEVTFETEIIHKPKYQITRLRDKCEFCGKVAKSVKETLIPGDDFDQKMIFLECGHLLIKKIPKGTQFDKLVSNWWEEEVKNCNHEWAGNRCTKCNEFKLFPFQQDGARFIEAALSVNKGAAIFDEMGLGKTVQALADIHFHAEERCPLLVITKSSIKFQWFKEILRWCGPKFIAQIISSSNEFLIPNLKVYIISYDMLVSKERNGKNGKKIKQGFDGQRLIDLGIKTVIIDESQQIKNPDASRTQEVRKLVKNCKVIPLSGTPWKNRGSEFFTVLNMLDPMKFYSYAQFVDRWVDVYFDGKYTKQGGIRRVEAFRDFTKDLLIRREVSDVMKEMPDVNRTLFYIEMEKVEQKSYDDEVSDFVAWYNDAQANDELNSFSSESNILAKLAKMRHITGLAKIPATVDYVKDFIESTGRKITVFVHHKDVGDILVNECKSAGITTFKLTAEMDAMSRFETQEKFNLTDSCVLIASTLASGEGINLQSCGDAIMHERQWNPQNEDQAAPGRFRRIGSTFKTVNVTFMTASDTVDDILAGIVDRKRQFFHTSMNKGDMPVWNTGGFAKELADGIVKSFENKKKGMK
jgi:hypothetical protein